LAQTAAKVRFPPFLPKWSVSAMLTAGVAVDLNECASDYGAIALAASLANRVNSEIIRLVLVASPARPPCRHAPFFGPMKCAEK